ncbi:sensor domain-containing diguanylate cyclase [Cognaticolwellia beringensis]|uniref:diguanylate cyclase n=1 Tax=Cognaticolwellia beringensis TaxID=1967665 RepID=A0A222GAI0_9GAMM|nr:diguanylate cyclase [Cognaticolwellia beringensis]ASP48384.1 sensor domain-containing diguanylate cyclase [Cognaticolwellia beringensis]
MLDTLCNDILNRLNTGILILDKNFNILMWNRFLEVHANKSDKQVVGKSIFAVFPELPKKWFERKLSSVIQLKNQSFCGWEQRHHLFELSHSRPITTDSDFMAQNCTFLPLEVEGEVERICILIEDVTDVCHYQTQLNKVLQELALASRVDGLTQAFNRKHWEECLAAEFSRAQRYKQTLALVMLDLDEFKLLNDTYGHQGGDKVLIDTSKAINEMLRMGDLFGRYGGEEFAVILPNTDLKGAKDVAERIRKTIEGNAIHYQDQMIRVTVSIGVAVMDEADARYESLISHADIALYKAKGAGRNRVCVA